MKIRIYPEYVALIAAVIFAMLVIANCAIQLRVDELGDATPPPVADDADPFQAKLARCRTVTPKDKAAFEECREVWAENRRRFFTSTKPNWSAPPDDKPDTSQPIEKNQDRVLPPVPRHDQSEVR